MSRKSVDIIFRIVGFTMMLVSFWCLAMCGQLIAYPLMNGQAMIASLWLVGGVVSILAILFFGCMTFGDY